MGGGPVDLSAPWTWDAPIARGEQLLTLSPDRSEAVVLNLSTGALVARRAASALGEPGYLLAVDDRIAAVAKDAVYLTAADDLASGTVTKSNTFPMGIRGRVVVAGGRLMVPRNDGIAVIDPAKPNGDAATLRLDRLGNALPLDSQLLVIDSQNLHSYLTWTVAQRLLQERMTASPEDPEPAVTYADLAYRSQHPEQIAEAADKALAAIDRAPMAEQNRLARQRLFRVLRDMVEASQEKWSSAQTSAPPPRRELLGKRGATRPQPVESAPLDLPVMARVLERMGRAAATPDERVSYLMALGRFQDADGKPALAAESYQTILADGVLASSNWRMQSAAVRADIEATRRVRQLVLERGPEAYRAFESSAERELNGLGTSVSTQALEKVARQYPAAAVTATAWSRAADLHEAAGRMHAAVAALREAMAAAEMARAAGSVTDPTMLGGIAGALVVRLQKLDQYFAAAQLVSRLRSQYPELVLFDHGTPIDAAAAQRDLLGRLAAIQRYPRIGPELKQETQALPGWTIMTPKSREQAGRACEHIMMVSAGESRVALWGVAGGAGAEGGAQGGTSNLQLMWSREFKGQAPVLLRLDPDSVYLFWDKTEGGEGAVVERIGAVGRRNALADRPLPLAVHGRSQLRPAAQHQPQHRRDAIDGMVRLTDVTVSMDEQVFAIVERSGRAAAFDLEGGKMLWNTTTSVNQVHDVDVGGGAVAIGGAQAPTGDRAGFAPIVSVLDARTGNLMHNMTELPNTVRWLRVADHGDQGAALIVATAAEIGSYDLVRAKPNWSIAGGGAFGSLDAWIFGNRLFILDEHRSLWLASLETGEISKQVLETYEHLIGSGPIDAAAIGAERQLTAFTTDRGVCVFDAGGRLVGIDSINGESEEGALVPPAISDAYFVAIQTQPHLGEGNQTQYDLSPPRLQDGHAPSVAPRRPGNGAAEDGGAGWPDPGDRGQQHGCVSRAGSGRREVTAGSRTRARRDGSRRRERPRCAAGLHQETRRRGGDAG
jgi:tetratricopeptide (TPR) repeat protein